MTCLARWPLYRVYRAQANIVFYGVYMRNYIKLVVALLLSVSLFANAQEESTDKNSVEAKLVAVAQSAGSIEFAIEQLLSEEDTTLSDSQKKALAALPDIAQVLFLSTVVDGTDTIDSALITSTQDGVTTEMGENLVDAFSPQLVDFDEEDREGNATETAAGPGSSGPVGLGSGSGGSGGGGVVASNN